MKLSKYDKKHRSALDKRGNKAKSIVADARKRALAVAVATGYTGEGEFYFKDYPKAKGQITDLLHEAAQQLVDNINAGVRYGWELSGEKMAVISAYVTKYADVSEKLVEKWADPLEKELADFVSRKIPTVSLSSHKTREMTLSSRVWNLSGQFKQEIELAVEAAMAQGMSADNLSREVRQYLNEPSRLFRRVRDKSGTLRLSRAAQAYHPGAGVYRSSYMNAMRMTATEINTAYRTADYLRWKSMPFVLGIEVRTTDTHRHEPDICDDLKGKYPKDFKFTGWHPWCRCYAVPILPSVEEMARWDDDYEFDGQISDVPGNFKNWYDENKSRIKNASSLPSFLKDNKSYL